MRISDWSSDVCSSDLLAVGVLHEGRAEFARVVALAGPFDLDHVGAEVAQDLRAGRAREDAGKIEDADTVERARHVYFNPENRLRVRSCAFSARSEEHTSELQSLMRISYAVFCLKKKNRKTNRAHTHEFAHAQH